MAEPFIGEIKMLPYSFAPRDFAWCEGQLLPISDNTALFSIIGTIYGGDGRTTMGVPNLKGRAPMHQGHGPSLSHRSIGEFGGYNAITLVEQQIPAHTHAVYTVKSPSESNIPNSNEYLGAGQSGTKIYTEVIENLTPMAPSTLQPAGGTQPHTNIQPTLYVNFCMALDGLYPSRN